MRDEKKEIDVELLLEFFSFEPKKNPTLYFRFELDEES